MRDAAMEEAVRAALAGVAGLEARAMFGGLAWLWRGHLLCAASGAGVLWRLGPEATTLWCAAGAAEAARMGARTMRGWVRIRPEQARDGVAMAAAREAAMAFVAALPDRE